MSKTRLFVIGIGGASCSGKSTCVQWLSKLLPGKIIHQDKFFKSDSQVPKTKLLKGNSDNQEQEQQDEITMLNWDCPDALDMVGFAQHLVNARKDGGIQHNMLGDNLAQVNEQDLTPQELELIESQVKRIQKESASDSFSGKSSLNNGTLHDGNNSSSSEIEFLIVDGFLLYTMESVFQNLDVRIFMHAPYETLKQRRAARMGYVTMEGYWQDPPGYFDQIVYPEYLKNNRFAIECIKTSSLAMERDLILVNSSTQSIGQCLMKILDAIEAKV